MNTSEQAVSEKLQQVQIWRQIFEAALSDREQLILRESLVYALPPRSIYARHPDQFANVVEIYRIKLELFHRLQQYHGLQQLYLEAIVR